jgi:hypothetical protein
MRLHTPALAAVLALLCSAPLGCAADAEDSAAVEGEEAELVKLSAAEIIGDLAMDGAPTQVNHTGSPRYRALRVQGLRGEKFRFTVRATSPGGRARIYFTNPTGYVVAKATAGADGVATLDVTVSYTSEFFLRIAKLSPGEATFDASGVWTNMPTAAAPWEPPAELLGKPVSLPGSCTEESWRDGPPGRYDRTRVPARLEVEVDKVAGHVRLVTKSAVIGMPIADHLTHTLEPSTSTFEQLATDPSRAEAKAYSQAPPTDGTFHGQLAKGGSLTVYVTHNINVPAPNGGSNKLECTFSNPAPGAPSSGICCGPFEHPQKTAAGWQCYHSDLYPQGACRYE